MLEVLLNCEHLSGFVKILLINMETNEQVMSPATTNCTPRGQISLQILPWHTSQSTQLYMLFYSLFASILEYLISQAIDCFRLEGFIGQSLYVYPNVVNENINQLSNFPHFIIQGQQSPCTFTQVIMVDNALARYKINKQANLHLSMCGSTHNSYKQTRIANTYQNKHTNGLTRRKGWQVLPVW